MQSRLRFLCRFEYSRRFIQGMRARLFAINVQSGFERINRRLCVREIWRCDYNSIQLLTIDHRAISLAAAQVLKKQRRTVGVLRNPVAANAGAAP